MKKDLISLKEIITELDKYDDGIVLNLKNLLKEDSFNYENVRRLTIESNLIERLKIYFENYMEGMTNA